MTQAEKFPDPFCSRAMLICSIIWLGKRMLRVVVLRVLFFVDMRFSAYAMAGVAYSRVSTFSGDYLRVTDNKGKTHDVLTGSDDGRHSNTSLAWGAGVQFNPTESVAIDIAYEGSGSGDWRTDGFIVGVGYKF
ncbi:TPA: Ail/Lom family outer membrane beta-barrel protein [Escherichia coli]|nr:Ail/Lom family outer membrane beta-barrel protein [Escherichia coli]EHD1514136.1 Ail/Lom family outer membrane beta-barrel protein [Escherichia coli]HAH4433381.1 Ail/Lom family outer membrane beta-barrel protein [Escherichia coli]HAH4446880.1 Ail/Lom family outer membrane beta-barrel protein [Escherichia coli]HAH9176137.1 Ail/Lom family outer membrane beta-barrel protein [Escherichia coli]